MPAMTAPGLLILRVVFAAVLVAHGAHQLFGLFGGPDSGAGLGGLAVTAAYFESKGITPGFPAAVVSGFIQLLGGLLIAAGVLTRWASLALVVYFALLIWRYQARAGFFLNWIFAPGRDHGYEMSVLLIGGLTCLALSGAGDWSFDGRRQKSAVSRAAARARLHRN